MNTLVDVWNDLIEQVKTIEVVFGTYGGQIDSFTNHNDFLFSWINKYGNCEISKIEYESDDKAFVYLTGWIN